MGRTFRMIFRVDSSEEIGTGHVIRCLTLAERLRQQSVVSLFVCRQLNGNLIEAIESRGFPVHRLPKPLPDWQASEGLPKHAAWLGVPWQQDAEETLNVIDGLPSPDWVIVDHYGLDARWEAKIRSKGVKIFVIDDLADRLHDCDVLLDQNLVAGMNERYLELVPKKATVLSGPAYALLHNDYARLRPRIVPREGSVRRLLISFGGIDRDNLTEAAVGALLDLDAPDLEADIILSSASSQFQRVAALVAKNDRLRLHDRVPSLAPFMLAADLAIGAGGTTTWERLCVGLPALVVTVADNQRPIATELAKQELIHWIGDADGVDQAQIKRALEGIVSSESDADWSSRAMSLVDGRGADRVCAVLLAHSGMPFSIRHAELRDENLLLEWINDPVTRSNAFDPQTIMPDEHRSWFRSRLRNPDGCVLFIIETSASVPFGQVRFDRRGEAWEISYAVAPDFRGRGAGRGMLAAAIESFLQCHANAALFGQVKIDNPASSRIFESLGFVARKGDLDRLL